MPKQIKNSTQQEIGSFKAALERIIYWFQFHERRLWHSQICALLKPSTCEEQLGLSSQDEPDW